MEIIKKNKTKKIITIFAVGLGLLIAINVVMWANSFAGEDIHRETIEPYIYDDENNNFAWHVDDKYRVTLDADHLATGKNYNNYHVKYNDACGLCSFRYKDVWMRVEKSYVDVFYCTYRKELEATIPTDWFEVDVSFSMKFTVYNSNGITMDEFVDKTERRTDKNDNLHDQNKQRFHANGGKGKSDFRTPEKPVTRICNELVNWGVITKDFADNTSLEELIKLGYVKVTLTDLHMNA